jgi:hypothetical protein
MDRNSTGETPSVLCPRQAAGLPNNLYGKGKGSTLGLALARKKELSTEDLEGPYNGAMYLVWIVGRYNLKEVGIRWGKRV